MRVLQLIDSLHAGGAERVAVNYANGLVAIVDGSYLCATRHEGILKDSINHRVEYLFLNKTKTIDFAAIKELKRFVKDNKIDIIHAHSSSFFLATLIRLQNRNLRIVWHDHYGNSEFLKDRPHRILKRCSRYFSQIFCVNKQLLDWSKTHLKTKKVDYLPNFAIESHVGHSTELKGESGKRIICLANLRPQKDHDNLLNAFVSVVEKHSDWSLHLVGKDFKDSYSERLKSEIVNLKLNKHVYLYDSRRDISNILNQCDIGVLSSKSEGLPIALLEYGLAKLPVVVTNVGECSNVIKNNQSGLLVDSENKATLAEAILKLIDNKELRFSLSENFKNKVELEYSSKSILTKVKTIYKTLL